MKCENGDIVEVDLFPWYGFNNPNTAVFEIWWHRKDGVEAGLQVLPLHFWKSFMLSFDYFTEQKIPVRDNARRRIVFGLGFFELFFDIYDDPHF